MEDIASKRRDNVSLFKKVFLYVKLAMMAVLSVFGSLYFMWSQFYSQVNLDKLPNPTTDDCIKFWMEDKNLFLAISSIVCSLIACCFIAFLIFHGIEKLVVKIMMRNANTGG